MLLFNQKRVGYADDAAYGSSGHLQYYIWAHERSNNSP